MVWMNCMIYFMVINDLIATPQINLYFTDDVNDNTMQHNCLLVDASKRGTIVDHIMMFYCLGEFPLKFHLNNDDHTHKFTFDQLAKQNITSQHLYLWSAPIDLIERYQLYLYHRSSESDVFYNCTMPRFGPMCQYELNYSYNPEASLDSIIDNIYYRNPYRPRELTCYEHLQCDRGSTLICLDWSEICDGKVDCLNDASDEEQCWQLEVNECAEDEHRCNNGQCIPGVFYYKFYASDCIDQSDQVGPLINRRFLCDIGHQPSTICEDIVCSDSPMTSSCVEERSVLLQKAMYLSNNSNIDADCWLAFRSLIDPLSFDDRHQFVEIVENRCPPMVYYPSMPVLFAEIYFGFPTNNASYLMDCPIEDLHICYKSSHFDDYFFETDKILFNQMACIPAQRYLSLFHVEKCSDTDELEETLSIIITELYVELKRYHQTFNYTLTICHRSNMYQCSRSSKCISTYRLLDFANDCPHKDDENSNISQVVQLEKTHHKCQLANKYIPRKNVENKNCDCLTPDGTWCEDEDFDINFLRNNISFQHICDGFNDLLPRMIGGKNESDETECERWECNNTYTYRNKVWNCPDGADEGGYWASPQLNCSSHQHLCVSPRTLQLMCLNLQKVNDKNIDCVGATDEPRLCGKYTQFINFREGKDFYCQMDDSPSCFSVQVLCDSEASCDNGEDEQFCQTNRTHPIFGSVCRDHNFLLRSDVENFLCNYRTPVRKLGIIYFKLDGLVESKKDPVTNFAPAVVLQMVDQFRCHRGLELRVWLNNKTHPTNACLCPPSYYGNRCQYQNQRISLALQFQSLPDPLHTLFIIIVYLIDNSTQRTVHSYEQFTYLSVRDCKTKFNIYLVYAQRPKDEKKHYSIHIDFYEKLSFQYRGSLLLPIHFPFLPVHRLAFIVHIPGRNHPLRHCFDRVCKHGQCMMYLYNSKNLSFCRCDPGWSGHDCTIEYNCTCSSGSSCVGVSANNRSICLCPMNRFGPRCLLTDSTCQRQDNTTCQNGGQCVSRNNYLIPSEKIMCLCPRGYSGDLCQFSDGKLVVSFAEDIALSQSISIHFIHAQQQKNHTRLTTFQTIPVRQNSVTIYWLQPFHLVFIELISKVYYLTWVQHAYNQSSIIENTIHPFDRCSNISELFDSTFLEWDLLRRIKYYHLPCQNQSLNISCFHDETHFCLCYNFGEKRLANCFYFNHHLTFNCKDGSECENDAQCIQDAPDCPTRSMCICRSCYFGRRCQFSTSGFGLSLDAILGYHISPQFSLTQQVAIVQFALGFTITLMFFGFVDGTLSLITFNNKTVRAVGCGLYLLGSSITTLLLMLFFGLKVLILILAQMQTISNRSLLQVHCYVVDFLLRSCLCMNDWLNACVAVERAVTAIKATKFDKKKSKQAAKYVMLILLIITVGSSMQDPFYRRLIDEENDEDNTTRTWCIITYPFSLEIYNSFMNTFHFFGPLASNFVSSLVLIVVKSRQQLNIHTKQRFKNVFREQIHRHKHLLTGPVILTILAVPRLIITFISKCMKSANDSWLFLIGYFVSFIPSILTFIIFIVPSKFYQTQLRKSVKQYRSVIQRILHPMS